MMQSLGLSFTQHRLYSDFIQVRARLLRHQFVCWVAGGAVRDLYLGRPVDDFDLVTDANTESLKKIFPEAVLVGESFGVLKIPVSGGDFFDLATFRQESDYIDGRRPSAVSASTPIEDAKRRDFTINALFWDSQNFTLVDLVGGVKDLQDRKLNCVGSAVVRFSEDHLRIVRLIRFAAQLRFSIDAQTHSAAMKLLSSIHQVSGERIWIEIKKIAGARNWDFILTMQLFQLFLKEIFATQLPTDFLKKHNISKVESYEIETLFFILMNLEADPAEIYKLLSTRLKLAKSELAIFEQIQFAIKHLQNKSVFEVCLQIEKREGLKKTIHFLSCLGFFAEDLIAACQKILDENLQPLVTGHELIKLLQGPQIGRALDEIRLLQFQGKIKTNAQALQIVMKKNSP